MKYRPDFPASFDCIEDARAHCQDFFAWYNGRPPPFGDRLMHRARMLEFEGKNYRLKKAVSRITMSPVSP